MTSERIYVEVLAKTGKRLLRGRIVAIGHFGVIGDYTITLDGGQQVLIDQDTVDIIAKEWNRLREGEP